MSNHRTPAQSIPPLDSHPFAPTALRPVRASSRALRANTHVHPHQHPWAQMVFSGEGVARVMTSSAAFVLPPSRAVWIPAHIEHAATVLEDAELHSVYVCQSMEGVAGPLAAQDVAWQTCRVIAVRPLLRELVVSLVLEDQAPEDAERRRNLSALMLSEIRRSQSMPLGIALPQDRRLRAFCEAFLSDPARDQALERLAADSGASVSTITRLFRKEMGSSFTRWREQVLLASALTLVARRLPIGQIAIALGYASPSAFSAMVTRVTGMPPSRFFLDRNAVAA